MIFIIDKLDLDPISEAVVSILDAPLVTDITAPNRVSSGDSCVFVTYGSGTEEILRTQRRFRSLGLPVTFVSLYEDELLLGPTVDGKVSGCIACLQKRFFGGRPVARQYAQRVACSPVQYNPPSLTHPLMEAACLLLTRSIVDKRDKHIVAPDESTVLSFNLFDFAVRQSTLIPDPTCPECSDLPFDSPSRAAMPLVSRPKKNKDDDRMASVNELKHIETVLAGDRTKLIPDQGIRWPVTRGAIVTVGVPLEHGSSEPCSGFSPSYSDALTVAVLEGLERYAGIRPRAYVPTVRASRAAIGDTAVDPRQFGLYNDETYAALKNSLVPYTDDLSLSYVWAHSFERGKPILLPQQLAYYSSAVMDEPRFVIEGSLGCALGTCIEECILHGIFEVVERDAFLLTWYAKISPPRLDPTEWKDPEILYYVRRLRADGFVLHALNITNDFGIPAIWLTARREDQKMPHSLSLAAAHLSPGKALKKAFRELMGMLCRYEIELRSTSVRRKIESLVEDPSRIKTMLDHGLYYCSPTVSDSMGFLFTGPDSASLVEMGSKASPYVSEDLTEDLRRIVNHIVGLGYDIVAVDQTTPEQSRVGLHTVKSLIKGAIPITWGEHLRRTTGLPRLDQAVKSAAVSHSSEAAALNPAPHPFP